MQLQSGTSIHILSRNKSRWDLSSRLSINGGTICIKLPKESTSASRDSIYYPKDNWRQLTTAEIDILLKQATDKDYGFVNHSLGGSIYTFSIPEDLRREFWKITNIESLLKKPNVPEQFHQVSNIVKYVDQNCFQVPSTRSLVIVRNKPSMRSTTFDPKFNSYIGLHFDNFSKPPVNKRFSSQVRAVINLGDEERSFVFINLTLIQIFNMLNLEHSPDNYQKYILASPMANIFMQNFPDHPVIRLLIKPGEGYIAPTQNIIHDGYTVDKTIVDTVMMIRADFDPEDFQK